jgi:type I restriction enzyme M protein
MLTGEIRSQIDQIWNAFWSGGISNPLEVIEQITYLLFLKRLDEQEIAEELKANRESEGQLFAIRVAELIHRETGQRPLLLWRRLRGERANSA